MIAVKNERTSANHVIFDKAMKIFILLVDDGKGGLLWKVVEQVKQGQTRSADALLDHVYATLLVEGKLSVDAKPSERELRPYCCTRRESLFQIFVVTEPWGYVIGHV